MKRSIVTWITTAVGMAFGFGLATQLVPGSVVPLPVMAGADLSTAQGVAWIALVTAVCGLAGYGLSARGVKLVTRAWEWTEQAIQATPGQDIIMGALGLILGLIIANLVSVSFVRIPWLGPILAIAGSLVLGVLGWIVAVRKRDEFVRLFGSLVAWKGDAGGEERRQEAPGATEGAAPTAEPERSPKFLDTSVIIDGRIADVCATGFITGPLVVARFVLDELQAIADSSDSLKRKRGRRGLDMLKQMQQEENVTVDIRELDVDHNAPVDQKLVEAAVTHGGCVVTNDFNLNKVAGLQGVAVLNINELANALKPVFLPGEEMEVEVIKDGKEAGQGVGYLDDGTMIVVEEGKDHMGDTITVAVTSVLQTAAGRMIFAKPTQVQNVS